MKIAIIVALSENHVIGRDGMLPWHLPEDLKHFRRMTMGKSLIMGRRTWHSIPTPLDGRQSIVLSNNPATVNRIHPCDIASSLDAAITIAQCTKSERDHKSQHIVVIGGSSVYRQVISLATDLWCTHVHAHVDGDTYFPEIDATWQETFREDYTKDARHCYPWSVVHYKRIRPSSGSPANALI